MADNYDDIRGMQFQYISADGFELTCYLPVIDDNKGLTIKVLDIDEAERLGYPMFRGEKDEGKITCINLEIRPDWRSDFVEAVNILRQIKKGEEVVYDCKEIDRKTRRIQNPFASLPSCAF